MYPVLMAADILAFKANRVPVGRDQVQHIEMARDFAQRFNHVYGEHFVLPEAVVEEQVATLPGLDGRKMSKSYDNTIALFAPRTELKKQIFSIVTDSRAPGEAKDTAGSALFEIYQAFADAGETAAMREAYAAGIGWGDAKQQLLDRIDAEVAPLRERYEALVAHPARIEEQLRDGAGRLRAKHATPFLAELREAVGLRDLGHAGGRSGRAKPAARVATPVFKQYREGDGRFHFKLVEGERVLLLSPGYDSPRDAGQRIALLKRDGLAAGGAGLSLGEGVAAADVDAALHALRASEAGPA
jgi:tryptophanyl-tRNA synthetase